MSTFSAKFFIENRNNLASSTADCYVVIPAHSALQYSADIAYPFRQDSNFWYLCGIDEPDLVLGIDCGSGKATLFLPDQNKYQKEWDGALDHGKLKKTSGVSEIRFKSELTPLLKQLKKQGRNVGFLKPPPTLIQPYGFYANPARQNLNDVLHKAGFSDDELIDVRKDIARLRQVKQPVELTAIKQAIEATAKGLSFSKEKLGAVKTEKELERLLISQFYAHGADGEAFDSIIAAGKNAATIHYVENNGPLNAKDLVLLDVGAKVDGYAADISRVWSIGGKLSQRQRELWEGCLDIQHYALRELKAGILLKEFQITFEDYAANVFKKLQCSMADKPFPHGISHHLGFDVHDAGVYDEPLPEGAVITVEPGIYLPDEGIGVRVEDDVLITKNGVEILSDKIPKLL